MDRKNISHKKIKLDFLTNILRTASENKNLLIEGNKPRTRRAVFFYADQALDETCLVGVEIDKMSGKAMFRLNDEYGAWKGFYATPVQVLETVSRYTPQDYEGFKKKFSLKTFSRKNLIDEL